MNATDIDRAQKGPGASRQGAVSPETAAKGVHSRIAVRVRPRAPLEADSGIAWASVVFPGYGHWHWVGGAAAAMRVRAMRTAGRMRDIKLEDEREASAALQSAREAPRSRMQSKL